MIKTWVMVNCAIALGTMVVGCGGGQSTSRPRDGGALQSDGPLLQDANWGDAPQPDAAPDGAAGAPNDAGPEDGGMNEASSGDGSTKQPASVFIAPNGSDANPCTRVAPCLTFNRGYQVAQPGEVVEVAAGSYGYQRIVQDPTKAGSARVVFRPAAGADVTVTSLDFGQTQANVPAPAHITVRDMSFTSIDASVEVWPGSQDIVLVNLTGHALQLLGGSQIRVDGGDFGKCTVTSDAATNCTSRMVGSDVVIDGASFHDVVHDGTQDPNDLNHTEGLFIRGCQGCTVRRSKFWHDTTMDIFIQNCCGLQPNKDVHLFTSWFAPEGTGAQGNAWNGGSAVYVEPLPGFIISHNSFSEKAGITMTPRTGQTWTGTSALVAANYYQRGSMACQPGVTYRNNVYVPFSQYTGQNPCNSTEKKAASFGYANDGVDGTLDYHETAASPGLGFADPQDSAAAGTDIDGNPWSPTAPDVGSDQR